MTPCFKGLPTTTDISTPMQDMNPSPPNPTTLLTLPRELRLHILSIHLTASTIPIDICTTTLRTTLPLTHLPTAPTSTILPIFHTSHLLRREATRLIATHITLSFLPGPRSPFDRRWRTAGSPLPPLLQENVAHVLIDARALDRDRASFPPLSQLPQLREVRFQCHVARIHDHDPTFTPSQDRRKYMKDHRTEMEERALRAVADALDLHPWVKVLAKDAAAPFRCVFESVVLFPESVGGKETRTVECRYVVDCDVSEVTETRVAMLDAPWREG